MSQFIDKLNQVSWVTPQTMGFRTAQQTPEKPKMLLIASLAGTSADGPADYAASADAGLLRIPKLSSGAKTLKEISQRVTDIPWGGWLSDISQAGIKQITKAGGDFLVFSAANTPLALLQNDAVGKVLEIETSLSDGLLRTVNELSIDAVLIAGGPEGEDVLTWHHLMLFQHRADLLTKPLLVSIPADVNANELQALWKAGVRGVVIEVKAGQSVDRLKELRQTIDKLAFPSPRQQGKTEALLPRMSIGADTLDEEDED